MQILAADLTPAGVAEMIRTVALGMLADTISEKKARTMLYALQNLLAAHNLAFQGKPAAPPAPAMPATSPQLQLVGISEDISVHERDIMKARARKKKGKRKR